MEKDARKIGHLDMDAFYAAVEQLDNPAYRGKPVIVGGLGPRGVVSTASYEAREFGVKSAMPMAKARKLCPHAIFLPPRFPRYKEISDHVRAIIRDYTPIIEPISLDEAFFDLTGSERVVGPAAEILRSIKSRVREETGLTCSVGLAPNRFLAKIASELEKPDGLVIITPDRVQEVLDPLPVERIFGVGKVTARRLHGLGIDTIRALQEAPIELLVREFGKYGRVLHHLARGEDDTPVRPEREAKSVSREVTFPHDVYEREEIERIVRRMAREVAGQLRRDGLLGKTVRIKVRFPDFRTITRQARMEAPTDSTYLIEETAIGLLRRRVELSGEGVRLLGVGVGNLTAGKARQLPLFTTDEALDRTIDRLQNTFGTRAVQRDGHPSPVNGKETVAGKGGSGYPESGGEAE